MKVTFRYKNEDYYELLVFKDNENSLHRRSKIINMLTIPATIFILLGTTIEYIMPNYIPTFIVSGILVVFWLIFSRKIYDYNRKRLLVRIAEKEFSKSIDSMKDTSITLTKEYIIKEIEGLYCKIEWSFISNVIITENNIFINLISGSVLNIPKRVFSTREEEVLFLRYLDEQINKNCGIKVDDNKFINQTDNDINDEVELSSISEENSNIKIVNNKIGMYSDRIIFDNINGSVKSGKWQKFVAFILLFSVALTIGGAIFYKEFTRPTEITQEEIYSLITESKLIEEKAIEEVKKTVEYEPSYVGDTYIIDISTEKDGEILVDLGQEVNYPAAYVQLYSTVNLKYKRGWYIEDIIYRDNYGLQPLFTAGESFLNGLSTDIYGKGYFEYNGVKYAFAPSYVDSLCTITEDGDFDSMKVGIAPYNKDGRIDMYVTMKYNFDIWGWELIEFETSGTR